MTATSEPTSLVLGPMLRHVDTTAAALWVETDAACTVSVTAGEQSWSARTFAVPTPTR